MNQYEVLLLLDPDAPDERHQEIVARARALVERDGGTWQSHEPWGRRRLAYEIDKKTDGVYHLLQFACEPSTLDEVSRVLKITDGVMRHMPTRRPAPHRRTAPVRPHASSSRRSEPATAAAATEEGA